MRKLSRALEPDLWLEMMLDLLTIYCSLWLLQLLGHLIIPGGWLTVWLWTVGQLEEEAHQVFVLGNLVVLLVVYWVPAGLYTLVDLTRPRLLYQYKVQPERSQAWLTATNLWRVATTVLANQILQTLIGSEVAWRLRYQYINMDQPLSEVPSLDRFVTPALYFTSDPVYQNDG